MSGRRKETQEKKSCNFARLAAFDEQPSINNTRLKNAILYSIQQLLHISRVSLDLKYSICSVLRMRLSHRTLPYDQVTSKPSVSTNTRYSKDTYGWGYAKARFKIQPFRPEHQSSRCLRDQTRNNGARLFSMSSPQQRTHTNLRRIRKFWSRKKQTSRLNPPPTTRLGTIRVHAQHVRREGRG